MDRQATYPRHSAIPDPRQQISQTLLALDSKGGTTLPAPYVDSAALRCTIRLSVIGTELLTIAFVSGWIVAIEGRGAAAREIHTFHNVSSNASHVASEQ